MVLTYTFPACWVHIDEEGSFLHTAFADGRTLESVPHPRKDGATARAYGYGEDAWLLWRQHDVLHHLVGTLFGHGQSPTIWSVAHEDAPNALPHWVRLQEEEFVGHIHRWLNGGQWHDALCSLADLRPSLPELQADLRRVLAGEMLDARVFAPLGMEGGNEDERE